MCVFLIFEFWVIWDQMSKCPKWAHHHPIWAISWCLDVILHVLWDIQQKSGKKSKTNRKSCALRQSLICGLILESSKLTHCLHNRTFTVFWHDHTRFVISEFWVGAQPAVWDLQKSLVRKSETNQNKSCSEASTHLRSNVKIFKICTLYTYPRYLWPFSEW